MTNDNSVPAAECARPGADLAPGTLPVPRLPRGVRRQHVLPGEGDVREETRVQCHVYSVQCHVYSL